jgi:hypothetical protein
LGGDVAPKPQTQVHMPARSVCFLIGN